MSIELHCPQCQKLIRAPDTAGGKHGKCPYCQHKVYIPMPPDEDDEISLAPIDEEDDKQAAELRREAAMAFAEVDKAPGVDSLPDDDGGDPALRGGSPDDVVDIGELVEEFIIAMRDSKLDEADAIADRLRAVKARASDHVRGLMLDQIPLAIENVPQPLVQGFLKALQDRLE